MSSNILHQSSWARSANGKSIELFSSQNGNERPLLFVGGVHGDEPEGVELAQKFLSWLQKNNNSNFHSWLLVPCLNIDGYSINERTNGHGVDLNRNFPSSDWNSFVKAPRYNPGPHPGSEPEVQAVCQLIHSTKPQVIIHFHSWEPCVVYTGAPGKPWAEKVSGRSGYEVREDIGYPTPGSLGQYGWLEHKTPVICIEEQEKISLEKVWPHFADGLQNVVRRT
jgi:predicted deacylase